MYLNHVQVQAEVSRRGAWLRRSSLGIKRVVDIVFAALGLFFLSPVFGLVAIAIRRDTPGPVFYRGRRMGRGGKEFLILKFRTMYETPESYFGPKVTASSDPRVTPLGKWLRSTKLNELPQLWNVLKGEMSLVGPRPEDSEMAAAWPPEAREVILSVRPGMTSPASVHYYNEEALLDADDLLDSYLNQVGPEKMRLDQMYVRSRTLLLDLDAILWTFLLLLPKIRSSGLPEELLFVGPITRIISRYLNWFVIDWLVMFFSIAFAAVIWRMTAPLHVGWVLAICVASGYAFIFSVTGAWMGLNKIAWTKAAAQDGYDLLPAWAVSTTVTFLLNLAARIFPPAMILTASILAGIGFISTRYRTRLALGLLRYLASYRTRSRAVRENVLIAGSGPAAQHAAWLFTHPLNAAKYRIAGFINDDLFFQGMRIFGARVLGRPGDIEHLLQHTPVDIVIMTEVQAGEEAYQAVIDACAAGRLRLMIIPDVITKLSCLPEAPSYIPVTGKDGGQAAGSACLACLIHCQSDAAHDPETDLLREPKKQRLNQ